MFYCHHWFTSTPAEQNIVLNPNSHYLIHDKKLFKECQTNPICSDILKEHNFLIINYKYVEFKILSLWKYVTN